MNIKDVEVGKINEYKTGPEPGLATEGPWHRIRRHQKTLDDALCTIKGNTPESETVRFFIIGQIEALNYMSRQFEV